ncbi:MAG: hypothetical protein ACRDSL_09390 [Pseudonocardiaceae bacterium]
MSDVAGGMAWVASGAGAIGGTAAAVAVQPVLVIPVLVLVVSLATLPLLISVLTLVVVFSPDSNRQARAEKILDRLLITLRDGRQNADDDPAHAGIGEVENLVR